MRGAALHAYSRQLTEPQASPMPAMNAAVSLVVSGVCLVCVAHCEGVLLGTGPYTGGMQHAHVATAVASKYGELRC